MASGRSLNQIKEITYVWNYKEWGGAQIYFFGLIREIKNKVNIRIVLPRESDEQLLKFIEQLGIECDFLENSSDLSEADSIKKKIKRYWRKFRSEFEVIRVLRKRDLRQAIVHIEFGPWQSFLWLVYLCLKTQVFITMHNSLPKVSQLRYLIWKAKFSFISNFNSFHIFPSNEDAKRALKPFVSADFFKKTKVTYTNVNPDEINNALSAVIDPVELKAKFKIPSEKFLVFCVGQFIDRKGRWTFLEAARTVRNNDRGIAFVWISNSSPSAEDLRKANDYGLGENFVFITSDEVGEEHIELFKLMRLADLFALVSFQEGLPIALLEAMALGIPSISTNVNAIPEAVKHMETGWLIEAGDSEHLAKAIQNLKEDTTLRSKIAQNGRDTVLASFNEKIVARIALNCYEDSLNGS